ncbi:hypothetical protein CC80DRAFT_542143 [Byssothecium circinans]|uniref:Uncharacterized protein n=1 Tax=Byssothecium circinans TaxID=147558 RepID=A0A6A5UGU9_9PLEO|nr:hypothetical protein CC80DRAFT_542143 [Byssothecium circinans]
MASAPTPAPPFPFAAPPPTKPPKILYLVLETTLSRSPVLTSATYPSLQNNITVHAAYANLDHALQHMNALADYREWSCARTVMSTVAEGQGEERTRSLEVGSQRVVGGAGAEEEERTMQVFVRRVTEGEKVVIAT